MLLEEFLFKLSLNLMIRLSVELVVSGVLIELLGKFLD